VLCNPAPIFARHYTISHIRHRAQSIEPALDAFLRLMLDLSPHFAVLYNGPRSGASAPDHQHFQAAPAGTLPVEADIRADGKLRLLKVVEGVEVFGAVGLGRAILMGVPVQYRGQSYATFKLLLNSVFLAAAQ